MLLKKAIEQIPGIDFRGEPDAEILGISYDSRSVQKGDLFVAIKGKEQMARFS
jgi:UDP-N-acetylmuramyl pentapeptide synthase